MLSTAEPLEADDAATADDSIDWAGLDERTWRTVEMFVGDGGACPLTDTGRAEVSMAV